MILTYNGYSYTYENEYFIIGDSNETNSEMWNKLINICGLSTITIDETTYDVKIRFNPNATNKYIDMNEVAPLGITTSVAICAQDIQGEDWEIRNIFFNGVSGLLLYSSTPMTKLHWLNFYISGSGRFILHYTSQQITISQCKFSGICNTSATIFCGKSSTYRTIYSMCTFNIKNIGTTTKFETDSTFNYCNIFYISHCVGNNTSNYAFNGRYTGTTIDGELYCGTSTPIAICNTTSGTTDFYFKAKVYTDVPTGATVSIWFDSSSGCEVVDLDNIITTYEPTITYSNCSYIKKFHFSDYPTDAELEAYLESINFPVV